MNLNTMIFLSRFGLLLLLVVVVVVVVLLIFCWLKNRSLVLKEEHLFRIWSMLSR